MQKDQRTENVQYYEENGRLKFSYVQENGTTKQQVKGVIPVQVTVKGLEAIKAYVDRRIQKNIERQRRKEFLADPNLPVETDYKGISLKGRIIYSDGIRVILVQLEEPQEYGGQGSINFGWASAIMGRFILDEGGDFSSSAIEGAQQVLTWIYDREKNKRKLPVQQIQVDAAKLAEELNQERKGTVE